MIDNATRLEEPLNPDVQVTKNDSLGALSLIMAKVGGKPYRIRFIMFGLESYEQYMFVAQSAPFCGWNGS